jgi:antitoxin (DNA-binding transcriptional repressor) of toxin-antitoxin stability system
VVRAWRARTPRTVELEQAKTQMDELIDDAEHGKPFAISVEGKPILKVTHMDQDAVDKLPKAED